MYNALEDELGSRPMGRIPEKPWCKSNTGRHPAKVPVVLIMCTCKKALSAM